jgi:hypothetical protein
VRFVHALLNAGAAVQCELGNPDLISHRLIDVGPQPVRRMPTWRRRMIIAAAGNAITSSSAVNRAFYGLTDCADRSVEIESAVNYLLFIVGLVELACHHAELKTK